MFVAFCLTPRPLPPTLWPTSCAAAVAVSAASLAI